MKKTTKRFVIALLSLALVLTGVNFVPSITGFGITEVQAAKQTKMYVKKDGVKVYAKRSEDSEVKKTLRLCDTVTMLGSADADGWVKVKYTSEKKGFVQRSKLAKVDGATRVMLSERKDILKKAKTNGWTLTDTKFDAGVYNGKKYAELEYYFRNDKYDFYIRAFHSDVANAPMEVVLYGARITKMKSGKDVQNSTVFTEGELLEFLETYSSN